MNSFFKNHPYRQHVFAVSGVIAYEQIAVLLFQYRTNLLIALLDYTMDVPFFYFIAEVLFPLLFDKPRLIWQAIPILLVAVSAYFLVAINKLLLLQWIYPDNNWSIFYQQYDTKVAARLLLFTGMALAYYFARKGIKHAHDAGRKEVLLVDARRRLLEIENQRVVIENDFLRAQISSHFIFNALLYIYSMVKEVSAPAASMVLLLSKIVRYNIRSTRQSGKMLLIDEIAHINDFVSLQKAREGSGFLEIIIDIDGALSGIEILPAIISTIVENVFTHGDLTESESPGRIHIRCIENRFAIHIWNLKLSDNSREVSGIGMDNTIKRIKQAYTGKYTLRIDDCPNHYELKLDIEL